MKTKQAVSVMALGLLCLTSYDAEDVHASALLGHAWGMVQGNIVTVTVHTQGGVPCTAQESGSESSGYTDRYEVPPDETGADMFSTPGTVTSDDRGISVFTFKYPKSMKPTRRWALVSCSTGDLQSSGGFQASYIVPNSRSKATQPTIAVHVTLDPQLAAVGTSQKIHITAMPHALCSLTRTEPPGGDLQTANYEGPVPVNSKGKYTWVWKASSAGIANVTCDLNGSLGTAKSTYLIRS